MKIDTDLLRQYKQHLPIDKNKQKHSQEYKALAILRYLYPQKYLTMAKGESPDLQDKDNGVGIEVVSAVRENDMKASRAFSDLHRTADENNIEKNIERIKSSGYSITSIQEDKFAISATGTSEGEKIVLQNNVRKKLERLRLYRKTFKTMGLAILLPEIPTSYAEEHCMEWIIESLSEAQNRFDFIYVLSHRFCIYYDTHTEFSEKRKLQGEEYTKLSIIAKMTAEGKLSLSDAEWL